VPAPRVQSAALATLARDVQQQALVLALRDVFTLVLWIVVIGTALFAAYLVFEAGAGLRKRAG